MRADAKAWRFGVLSFTGMGHVNPLVALAQELKARGHAVAFFDKSKIADYVRHAGLDFISVGGEQCFPKTSRMMATGAGVWSDVATIRANLKRAIGEIETYLQNLPPLLIRSGVEALIIDEVALTGPTVAELLHLPYFVVSTSVPHNLGWNGLPQQLSQERSGSCLDQLQRILFEHSVFRTRGPIRDAIDRYRCNVGLEPARDASTHYSCLAQITQFPRPLDQPRTHLPSNFYYAGPFISQIARPPVEFPWSRLDGRPLIYASLGTTRNIRPDILRMIAEACRNIDAQLAISLGGRFDPEVFSDMPGDPLVVRYAPQLELLRIASLVITHAGLNTVLETLMEGTPLIAIPLAYDQPAIADRLARLEVAAVLSPRDLSSERLRTAIVKLLSDSRYRESAQKVGADLRLLRGTRHAADIIETALMKYVGVAHPDTNRTHLHDYASVSS